MIRLAITTDRGVEMQRPGLGDLAGRGAACGVRPDLRKRVHRLLAVDYPQTYAQGKSLIVGANLLPSSADTSSAPLRAGRVANSGPRKDSCYHGAPPGSARRECPGAREGAGAERRLREADSVMRLRRADHGEPCSFAAGQGSPWLSLTNEHKAFGSGCHDNG